jgi:hypothetical protein
MIIDEDVDLNQIRINNIWGIGIRKEFVSARFFMYF